MLYVTDCTIFQHVISIYCTYRYPLGVHKSKITIATWYPVTLL